MPDCSYCGERFDGEDAYLRHLADAHRDELGRIDARRVESFESGDDGTSMSTTALLLGGLAVAVVAVVLGVTFLDGGSGADAGSVEGAPLPERGDEAALRSVQQFPSEGRAHVERGTNVDYDTSPPTSGPHYDGTVEAGFYEETPPVGDLVHTLEHGAVVVYYDPGATTPEARESLQAFASEHTGTWRSVVVAPNPADDPESPYVLTAWRHMLRMERYDAEVVQAFVAEFLGRGPENPVRNVDAARTGPAPNGRLRAPR
jgi:hypothetical protein